MDSYISCLLRRLGREQLWPLPPLWLPGVVGPGSIANEQGASTLAVKFTMRGRRPSGLLAALTVEIECQLTPTATIFDIEAGSNVGYYRSRGSVGCRHPASEPEDVTGLALQYEHLSDLGV